MLRSFPDIDIELIKKNILFLNLNSSIMEEVLHNNQSKIDLEIPFFNKSKLDLQLDQFSVYSNDLTITRNTISGQVIERYNPSMKTYRITNIHLDGVFIFSDRGVKGVFRMNNQTYQIDKLNDQDIYFLINIKHSPIEFDFMCAHDNLISTETLEHSNYRISSSSLGCIEIAIEIDFYTFQSFGNYQIAVDWALEMISVVNELFKTDLQLGLKSNSAQIWEIEDPYSIFIEDPQNMLFSIRQNWSSSSSLSSIDRDLVHLFSKRNNTGTGGIAFLNGLGNNWNGYGFSSSLTDVLEYIDLPVPYFFWNIYCLAHELGHNFGARHTQWCGWEGGPIDNCTDHEEMIVDECANYINNPSPQVGTIMSYCHSWSFNSGGGIEMQFNNLVKESIIDYLINQNLDNCDFEILGCIDQTACNYDITANLDDNSCLYPEIGFDCFGNCIIDDNQDGICDHSLESSSNTKMNELILYPNPAKNYLKIAMNSVFNEIIYLELFNKLGQLTLSKQILDFNQEIDISSISPGLYNAQIINKDKIKTQNIIIQ